MYLLILLASLLFVSPALAGGPATVIWPDGTVTHAYPGTNGGPTIIMPQRGQPTFVYPSARPGSPMTIMPPSGQPAFAYPPIGAAPVTVLPSVIDPYQSLTPTTIPITPYPYSTIGSPSSTMPDALPDYDPYGSFK